MEEFPPEMQIPEATKVDMAVPGWHINGHGESCRNNFNLSYMEEAARTVGEDIETIWAGTNPLAPSIHEMGPAAWHDTLNDHWNGWNFHKVIRFRAFFFFSSFFSYPYLSLSFLGLSLLKRFNEAIEMSAKQTDIFSQLSATFSSKTIVKWEALVANWNADPKAPNPYQEPKNSMLRLSDVRLSDILCLCT
jgi:hypothetical protein